MEYNETINILPQLRPEQGEEPYMNKPVLVVMAAGMGSRYGGMKQIDPVGPNGQVIVDYSLYDARRAGFETVIFVIKHEIEDAFKAAIGERVSKAMNVKYAFQQLDELPAGFAVPEGRVKPWGPWKSESPESAHRQKNPCGRTENGCFHILGWHL